MLVLTLPRKPPAATSLVLTSDGASAEDELRAWIERAQAGDVAAFEGIYHRCVGRVNAVCLRLCGHGDEAQSLVQDVFVRAWEHLASFRGDASFVTWLHRLTINEVLQARRKWLRRSDRERQVAELGVATPHMRSDAGMDLERAIATLPERARMVFVLHEIEGLGHEEIAGLMKVTVGTSKAQLHRARELLREVLR